MPAEPETPSSKVEEPVGPEGSAVLEPRSKHGMSRAQKILFFATGWLIVLMPFLFWWNTWFGRHLSDQQMSEYLHDDKKPRHIQQALVQLGDRMAGPHNTGPEKIGLEPNPRPDEKTARWYPELIRLASYPGGENREHAG